MAWLAQLMPRRSPGRPPGSVNRSTAQWAAYIKTTYGSPLDEAARMCGMSIADLARALGCTRLEAAEFHLQGLEFALAYTHAEMPRAVAVDAVIAGGSEASLAMFLAPAVAVAVTADNPPSDDESPIT